MLALRSALCRAPQASVFSSFQKRTFLSAASAKVLSSSLPLPTPQASLKFQRRLCCSESLKKNERALENEPEVEAKFGGPNTEGGLGGTREKEAYAIVYTCKQCETRSAKKISKRSYHHGIVIIRCPGCDSLHLIADHYKWFSDAPTTIEDILREKGETVWKGDVGGEGGMKEKRGEQDEVPLDIEGLTQGQEESLKRAIADSISKD